jgi:hypothetical protein
MDSNNNEVDVISDKDLKRMRMINTFKEKMNKCLNDFKENTNKHLNEIRGRKQDMNE